MIVKKAVITAAGHDQRDLPLQNIVNAAGESHTALSQLLLEIHNAGISEIAVIVAPGDVDPYREAAGRFGENTTFIVQEQPRGYGHAVLTADAFVDGDAFLLMVSDHLYLSSGEKSCVQQLLEVATTEACSVSAVQSTHESQLPYYGTVGGIRVPGSDSLYEIKKVVEKPTPTLAEQELIVPGLRSAQYLCFFGMHVLTSEAMDYLRDLSASLTSNASFGLTETLEHLAGSTRYLAYQTDGRRFNIAEDYGLLIAELALALSGSQRDMILTKIVELLAIERR